MKELEFEGEVIRISNRSCEHGKKALQLSLLSQKGRWGKTGDRQFKYVLGFALTNEGGELAAHDVALSWTGSEPPDAARLFLEKKSILKVCFDVDLIGRKYRSILDLAGLTRLSLKELAVQELSSLPRLYAYTCFVLFSRISSKHNIVNAIYDPEDQANDDLVPSLPPPPPEETQEEKHIQKRSSGPPTPKFTLGKNKWPLSAQDSTNKPKRKKVVRKQSSAIEIDPMRTFDVAALRHHLEPLAPAKAYVYKAIMAITPGTTPIDIATIATLRNIKESTIITYLDDALENGYPYDLLPLYTILGGEDQFYRVADTLRTTSVRDTYQQYTELSYNQILLVQNHLARAAAREEQSIPLSRALPAPEAEDQEATVTEFRIFFV